MATALALPTSYVPAATSCRVLQVGTGCPYTTILDAITVANTLTRTAVNQVVIDIFPGTYTENITIPTFTSLIGHTDGMIGDVTITNRVAGTATITMNTTTGSMHFFKNLHIINTSDTTTVSCINQPAGAYAHLIYVNNCRFTKTVTIASDTHAYFLVNWGALGAANTVVMTSCFIRGDSVVGTATLTLWGINIGAGSFTIKDSIITIVLTDAITFADGAGIETFTNPCTVHVDTCQIRLTGPPPGGGGVSNLNGIVTTVVPIAGDPTNTAIATLFELIDGETNVGIRNNEPLGGSAMFATGNVIRCLTGGTENTGISDGASGSVTTCSGNQITAATAQLVGANVTSARIAGMLRPVGTVVNNALVCYRTATGVAGITPGAAIPVNTPANGVHNMTFTDGMLTAYV